MKIVTILPINVEDSILKCQEQWEKVPKTINIIETIKDIVMSQSRKKLTITTDIWKGMIRIHEKGKPRDI